MSRWVYLHQGLNRHARRALVAQGKAEAADLAPMIAKPYDIGKRKTKIAVRFVAAKMKEQIAAMPAAAA